MLLPDGSSQEKFGSFSGREQALHRSHRSLDRFGQLHNILAALQVDLQPLWASKALLVCWLEVIFNVNILLATPLRTAKRIKNQSASNMGGKDGATTDNDDKTSPFNEANMIFPQSMDELLDELCQKL